MLRKLTMVVLLLASIGLSNVLLFAQAGSQDTVNSSPRPRVGFDTPGQAFFVSTGMQFVPSNVSSASPTALQAYDVAVFGFMLPYAIVINHVSIQVSKPIAVSTMNAGIYDASGNLLIDSGTFDTSTNSPQYKINAIAAPVTLTPGFYYFAYSVSNTSVKLATLAPQDGTSTAANAFSLSSFNTTGVQPRYGIATNVVSNGALPATLGPIINNENQIIPIVVFEP
jgi:hypothetical protein